MPFKKGQSGNLYGRPKKLVGERTKKTESNILRKKYAAGDLSDFLEARPKHFGDHEGEMQLIMLEHLPSIPSKYLNQEMSRRYRLRNISSEMCGLLGFGG